ncbi:MAG TPA: phage tail protein [Solirubrobacteraceae bacterium]
MADGNGNGDGPQVYTNCYVSVEITGLANVDQGASMAKLLFNSFTPPAWSTETPKHKFYGDQGKTEILHGGARNENWSPVQLGRGVDTQYVLYNWVQEIRQKGPTAAKKDVKITVQAPAGDQPICVWSGTGAVITQYGQSASNAAGNEILTENITIDAETWDMLDGGGQPINGGPDGGGGGGGS